MKKISVFREINLNADMNKTRIILDNFRELERMKREIFKTNMQVIICNENLSQTTYNQCSMNVLRLQIRE